MAVEQLSARPGPELLLIRHGITDMAGKLCGHLDPPLNDLGRAQASALVPLLRNREISRLYASDLRRALQTAEPLTHLWRIPVLARVDLREMSFGAWEGKRWSELKAGPLKPEIQNVESSPETFAPGGESFTCFRDRIACALNQIVISSEGQSAAVITHMGVIRVALKDLSGAAERPIEHCGVYRFLLHRNSLTFTGQLA